MLVSIGAGQGENLLTSWRDVLSIGVVVDEAERVALLERVDHVPVVQVEPVRDSGRDVLGQRVRECPAAVSAVIWDRSNSLATSAVKQVETETVPGIRAQKVAWERLLDKEEPASSVSELLPAAGRFAPKASVRERRLGNHCPLPLVVLDLAICAPSLPFRVVHWCPCQHM